MDYFNSITSWFGWGAATFEDPPTTTSDESTTDEHQANKSDEDGKKEEAVRGHDGGDAGVAVGNLVDLASVSTPEEGSVGELLDLAGDAGGGSFVSSSTDDGGQAAELKRKRSGGRSALRISTVTSSAESKYWIIIRDEYCS
jgi:hypothetical protein